MIGSLFKKKEKPRVFLGLLAVAPRTDWKRHFDEQAVFVEDANLDTALRHSLTEVFSLPPADRVTNPMPTDLVLDVLILKFQSGEGGFLSIGDMGLPIFWRPKITVASRLYSLSTQKTQAIFSVTEKMPWRQYFARTISWRAIVRFGPLFDKNDIEYLLYQACAKLLVKVQKEI